MDQYHRQLKKIADSLKKMADSTQSVLQFKIPSVSEELKILSKNMKSAINNIAWDEIKQFNEVVSLIDKYITLGWSMPQLMLTSIYEELPGYNDSEENLEKYVLNKINDDNFFEPFKEYMIFALEEKKQATFRDTLKLIDQGYYTQSALHCFAVIENLLREISITDTSELFTKNLLKHTKKELETLNIMTEKQLNVLMLYNMLNTIEKILIPELFANHKDQPTGISILRNELSHGNADESKINQTDCYKLLMIILSLAEIKKSR